MAKRCMYKSIILSLYLHLALIYISEIVSISNIWPTLNSLPLTFGSSEFLLDANHIFIQSIVLGGIFSTETSTIHRACNDEVS